MNNGSKFSFSLGTVRIFFKFLLQIMIHIFLAASKNCYAYLKMVFDTFPFEVDDRIFLVFFIYLKFSIRIFLDQNGQFASLVCRFGSSFTFKKSLNTKS